MLNLVVLGAVGLVMLGCVYYFVRSYQASAGATTWQKLLDAAKNSATVLWSYIVMAGGSLMTWSVNAADAFNLPDVRNFVQAHLTPEMFGVTLVIIALVTFFARLRTL